MWEYDVKIIKANTEILKVKMNEYGKCGWEIFSCEKVGETNEFGSTGGIIYKYELKMKKFSK